MLKIGVLGAGHLGKIHIQCIKEIKELELIGFYDPNKDVSQAVAKEKNTRAFDSMEALINEVDIIDIVTPTLNHYDCAVYAIKNSKHIFIEKPITHTLKEAKTLLNLSREANIKVQVGHVERFNPAFRAALPYIEQPMFIETHRLAQFNPRGTDVSVVLDLMIHDIDILLSIVKSNIRKIHANGIPIISDTADIANARIEFDNGCIANLTASRISLFNMRKSRIFQRNAYISIDFLKKESEIIQLKNEINTSNPTSVIWDLGEKGKKQLIFNKPNIVQTNAIKNEIESLLNAINNNTNTEVPIYDGYKSMEIAQQISEKIAFATVL